MGTKVTYSHVHASDLTTDLTTEVLSCASAQRKGEMDAQLPSWWREWSCPTKKRHQFRPAAASCVVLSAAKAVRHCVCTYVQNGRDGAKWAAPLTVSCCRSKAFQQVHQQGALADHLQASVAANVAGQPGQACTRHDPAALRPRQHATCRPASLPRNKTLPQHLHSRQSVG